MSNYIDTIYNEKIRPHTDYPDKMCLFFFNKFGMKKGQKLLDVGYGRGDFLKGFKDSGLEVFGLDIEKYKSEIAKNIEIRSCNFEVDLFPFENNCFDTVFSKSVIEHIKVPDNFMKEIIRVLKPGGKLIILTPDWQSQMNIFYDDYTHVHPYTAIGLRDMLKVFGFKKVEAEKFYQLPILWRYAWLKIFSRLLQLFGPVKKIYKNKFIRWSRELMVLAYGEK